jgi:error-prone DNA polymerase
MTLELAEELLDFPRHTATHVGGFVITRGPLTELAVVTNAAMEGRTVSNGTRTTSTRSAS